MNRYSMGRHFTGFHKQVLLAIALATTLAAQTQLSGTYSFVQDSDGGSADAGSLVTLTFTNGKVTFRAENGAGPLLDEGAYQLSGDRITFSLPKIGRSVQNLSFSMAGTNLVLPFKVFSDGPGTSTWAPVPPPGSANSGDSANNQAQAGDAKSGESGDANGPAGEGDDQAPMGGENGDFQRVRRGRPPVDDPFFNIPDVGIGGKDVIFGCKQTRWDNPQVCRKTNPHQPINCGSGCMISKPKCAALNEPTLIQLYNVAVFPDQKGGFGIAAAFNQSHGADPGAALTMHIVEKFYSVYTKNVVVQMTNNKPEENADLDDGFGGKYTLTVFSPSLEELSPAGLVSTIGHEMVHLEQRQRKLGLSYVRGTKAAKDALFELEASSWQTGVRNFNWQIGTSKVAGCVPQSEQLTFDALMVCREWQAVNLIANMGKDGKDEMAKWLDANPWTKQVWLPKHQDWRTMKPFASSKVKFNGGGADGNQVDCNQVLGTQ